jgi:hypothetical protein
MHEERVEEKHCAFVECGFTSPTSTWARVSEQPGRANVLVSRERGAISELAHSLATVELRDASIQNPMSILRPATSRSPGSRGRSPSLHIVV